MGARIGIILALGGILCACANTGPLPIGPDTYQISTRVPLSGPAGAEGEAIQTADAFCTSHHRKMLLQHENSYECALHGGCGEAQITFYCLRVGDPMLKRAAMHDGPPVKIEAGPEH